MNLKENVHMQLDPECVVLECNSFPVALDREMTNVVAALKK